MSEMWIADGEKYALVGLSANIDGTIPRHEIGPRLWALAGNRFEFPEDWREWLGSLRAEDVESCNLFLMSKCKSSQPDVLDGENQELQHLVSLFYVGLLLAAVFAPAHKPILLTGSRRQNQIGIRQSSDFDTPVPNEFRPYPALSAADLETAARLGLKILQIEKTPIEGRRWRFFRVLHLYQEARALPDILERIHQYVRCIDGLILPAPGKTKQQFKSRTELFIGPHHHELMGELYDVRSVVEHLHANRYFDAFDRDVRLDLVKKEAIVEHIARTSLAHIVEDPALWPHFANTASLAEFWSLSSTERAKLWAAPIDPMEALEDFEPRYISDERLGKK